jgi:hypothetical protein
VPHACKALETVITIETNATGPAVVPARMFAQSVRYCNALLIPRHSQQIKAFHSLSLVRHSSREPF